MLWGAGHPQPTMSRVKGKYMRIGVVRYWAGRPAAEHEVIARIESAAQARGHELVELNPDGSALDDPDTFPEDLDFVLNLHFSSPKIRDIPHVGALWNPIQFYYHFGFNPHFFNQVSHDYLATCGSRTVEAAFEPFRPDLSWSDLPVLNHTVPERYLDPVNRTNRRLFYIGINWERMANTKGRHQSLLTLLDKADVSSIHGPREIDGIAPWAGFKTYQGDVPFDGWSVVEAISAAGAALILSSPNHYRDGVMSCRPFEAAAAGVPLVSEHHPFMLEHFNDAALFFDERASEQEQAEEIVEIINKLNDDPEYAQAMSVRAQEILRTKFNLDEQFNNLCEWVTHQEQQKKRPAQVTATAVIVPTASPEDTQDWASDNHEVLSRFSSILFAPPIRSAEWERVAEKISPSTRFVVGTRPDASWSERAGCAARDLEGPVSFLLGCENLYRSYPDEVASCESSAKLLAAVTVPAHDDGQKANARLPKLLCGSTEDWRTPPVSAVVTTGAHLRELKDLLGPGLHLGIISAAGREHHSQSPNFIPSFSVAQEETAQWSVGDLAGAELHKDIEYARSLPTDVCALIPESLLRPLGTSIDSVASVVNRINDPVAAEASPGFMVEVAHGFSRREFGRRGDFWWVTSDLATLHVKNFTGHRQTGRLKFAPRTLPGAPPLLLVLTWPDGTESDPIPVSGKRVSLTFTIDPQLTYEIRLSATGKAMHVAGDSRDLWFRLTQVSMVSTGKLHFERLLLSLRNRFPSRVARRRRFRYQLR